MHRRGSLGPGAFRGVGCWGICCFLAAVLTLPLLSRGPANATLAVDDYAIIGEAFHAADLDDWSRSGRLMQQIDDPLAVKLFRWLTLVENKAGATFDQLATFIIENAAWPRMDALQTMAEDRLTDSADKSLTLQLFKTRDPLTTRGRVRFAEALLAAGDEKAAVREVKRAWIFGEFSAKEEKRFLERHRRHLNGSDHMARLDNLLWDRQWRAAQRMVGRVADDRQKLAKARLALQQQSPGVDVAVNSVPASLAKDAGLLYDRIRWRRYKQKHDGARELLLDPPQQLGRADRWWYERSYQVRKLITERDFDGAYRLASRHGQLKGGDYAEAEWLSGWLALRFVNRPKTAFRHFVRLYDRVKAPVRQARAAYWAGRAAASQGDDAGATAWYRRAATHHASYYGQQAILELDDVAAVPPPPEPTTGERAAFEASELTQVARLLIASGATSRVDDFLAELSATAETAAEIGMIADYANAAGRPTLVAKLGRTAAFEGKVHEHAAFPIPKIEGLLQPAAASVDSSLLLGLARQESMFRSKAASSAGARGLLQLLPSTARIVAKRLGEDYDADRLTADPDYNALLGGHFLEFLIERFDGELGLALAAYNAGPVRVKRWLELHGDPRDGGPYDMIDWIELIPFDETRNYVQRVLEGHGVYKRRLAENDIELIDYPGINLANPPHVPMPRPHDLVRGTVAQPGGQAKTEVVHRPRFRPDLDLASAGKSSDQLSFDDRQNRDIAADEAGREVPARLPAAGQPKL